MSTDAAEQAAPEAPPLTRKTLVYVLVRTTCWVVFKLLFRFKIHGRVPAEGGCLIVSNHQSFLDIPLVSLCTRRHVAFVARDSLADSGWLAFVMRQCGAILVRRGRADRKALERMIAHLAAGDCVVVFPEGTRTTDGKVGRFRGGALLAARRARVPVVPAAIRGAFDAWPRSRKLPRPGRVSFHLGEPTDPRAEGAEERIEAEVRRLAEGSG